jgi:hypothetical protein|tara:strand:+ start:155 stop:376 length:222 start_codon:yes stop_codon:yes gene_type:complete
MRISDQALGAIMMALQKSLIEQTDIVPVLREFNFQVNENEELTVMNPPVFKFDQEPIEAASKVDENFKTVGSD